MSDFASLSLFPATPDQVFASRKHSWAEWAKGLSIEEYLQRDALLEVLEHAADGKLITWILAPRNDPQTLDFKCSCETYLRKGFLVDFSVSGGQPTPSEIHCYGIASVFTPAQNRSKGYAKHMMRLLHWVMAPHSALPPFPTGMWGAPPPSSQSGKAKFSALYSDIGDFYSLCGPGDEAGSGWAVRGAVWTLWDVGQADESESESAKLEWEWLDIPEVNNLMQADTEAIKGEMIEWTKSTGRRSFAFLPWEGTGLFQIHRILLSPNVPQTKKWGLRSKAGDGPTFATWTIDTYSSSTHLVITRLRATKTAFPHLIRQIKQLAREHGMQKVEVWNLPEELIGVASALGGKTDERDEHLSAFMWYGEGLAGDVEWLFNEKYSWC